MDLNAILRRSAARQTLARLEKYAVGRAHFDQDVVIGSMGLSEDEADMYETTLQIVLGAQQAAPVQAGPARTTERKLS